MFLHHCFLIGFKADVDVMLEQKLRGFSSKIDKSLKLASYFHAVAKYKMYRAKQLFTDVFINWNLRKGTTFVLIQI
jgi:hypothetical protein